MPSIIIYIQEEGFEEKKTTSFLDRKHPIPTVNTFTKSENNKFGSPNNKWYWKVVEVVDQLPCILNQGKLEGFWLECSISGLKVKENAPQEQNY